MRIIYCSNENILLKSLNITYLLIIESEKFVVEGMSNHFLEQMKKCGIIIKLIEIFKNDNYKEKKIKIHSVTIISYFFKANSLPSEINKTIISFLHN